MAPALRLTRAQLLSLMLACWLLFTAFAFMMGRAYLLRLEDNADQLSEAYVRAESIALNQAVLRTVEAADTVQRMLQAKMRLSPDDQEVDVLGDYLTDLARGELFGILQVAAIDMTGRLVWSTVSGWRPVDLSDREHFRVHLEPGRPLSLFISAPLIGRASRRYSIQFSRPYVNEEGVVLGVGVISMDPAELSQRLRESVARKNVLAEVLRLPSGHVIADNLLDTSRLGAGERPEHPVVRAAMGQASGVLRYQDEKTGNLKVASWQKMPGLMALAVAELDLDLERDDAKADAEPAVWVTVLAISSLGASGIGMLGLFLDRRQTALLVARAEQRAAAERMVRHRIEELVEGLPAAVYRGRMGKDGALRLSFLSSSFERLAGAMMPQEEGGQDPIAPRVHASAAEERLALLRDVRRHGSGMLEYRLMREDGRSIWVREWIRRLAVAEDGSLDVVGQIVDIDEERHLVRRASVAGKMASLGELATGLAHELNQPLAVISLSAENAIEHLDQATGGAAEGLRKRLARIAAQAARARAPSLTTCVSSAVPTRERSAPSACARWWRGRCSCCTAASRRTTSAPRSACRTTCRWCSPSRYLSSRCWSISRAMPAMPCSRARPSSAAFGSRRRWTIRPWCH